MRIAKVLYKGETAGMITQNDDGSFYFRYDDRWITDDSKPSISLTLPKSTKEFSSPILFAFFYHLLPEGINKRMVCRTFKIDEDDAFGILLHTSKNDTIGAVTLERI